MTTVTRVQLDVDDLVEISARIPLESMGDLLAVELRDADPFVALGAARLDLPVPYGPWIRVGEERSAGTVARDLATLSIMGATFGAVVEASPGAYEAIVALLKGGPVTLDRDEVHLVGAYRHPVPTSEVALWLARDNQLVGPKSTLTRRGHLVVGAMTLEFYEA